MAIAISEEAKSNILEIINGYFSKPTQAKFSSQSELEDAIAYDVISLIKQIPVSDGWIGVSEKLPEMWQEVLIHCGCDKPCEGKFTTSGWRYADGDKPVRPVTHWQHLPELPVTG